MTDHGFPVGTAVKAQLDPLEITGVPEIWEMVQGQVAEVRADGTYLVNWKHFDQVDRAKDGAHQLSK